MRSSSDSSDPVSNGWTFLSTGGLRSGVAGGGGSASSAGSADVVTDVVGIGARGPAAGLVGDHERLHATGATDQLVVLPGVGSVAEEGHERLAPGVDAAVHPVAGNVHRLAG